MAKFGGKQVGAGRPKGSKDTRTQELVKKAVEGGITPLEYMLKVMRDPTAALDRRDAMAEKAAPYIHPKLASFHADINVTNVETKLAELE
jgi:hypothetical protein